MNGKIVKKGIQILTSMPEISIKAETIFKIGKFQVTNSLILGSVVLLFLLIFAIIYEKDSKLKKKSNFYYFVNFSLKAVYDLFEGVLKDKTPIFFPLLGSFFLFILLNNWFGLLPGVGSLIVFHSPLLRGNNADLNATFALAIISVVMIQIYGIKFLGFKGYLKKFIDLTNPINFFLGILEILSEFSRILSFSFRLFGNIFAGEVLLTIVAFLVPVLASFPFVVLEIFVGFIQALVFSMLTAVFISGAIAEHQ